MNTRTKYTNIKTETKKLVWDRDGGCCVLCGKHVSVFNSNAHIVPRSQGGLGVKENIVTLCNTCHYELDNTPKRSKLMPMVKHYIKGYYQEWNEDDMKYRKEMKYE